MLIFIVDHHDWYSSRSLFTTLWHLVVLRSWVPIIIIIEVSIVFVHVPNLVLLTIPIPIPLCLGRTNIRV